MGFVFITYGVQSVQKINLEPRMTHWLKMTITDISDGIDIGVGFDGVVGMRIDTIDPWVEQAIHRDPCADAGDGD